MPSLLDVRLGARTHSLPVEQLGLLERWYAAQPVARVAGCVLEFAAPVSEPVLRDTLGALRDRHRDALAVSLRTTSRGPIFVPIENAPLPLATAANAEIWPIAEAALSAPFSDSAPLWRVTRSHDGRALIATFHHVIADGMSVSIFARELLALLRGDTLAPSVEPRLPLDVRLDLRPRLRVLLNELLPRRTPAFYAGSAHANTLLHTALTPFQLGAAELSTLAERARREQATLQGALCAAGLVASAVIQRGLPLQARMLSPVSLRQLCSPAAQGFGDFLCGIESDHALHASAKFWPFAAQYSRFLRAALPSAPQRLGLLRFAGDLTERAQKLLDTRPNARTATLEVSNLGRIDGIADATLWFIQGNHYHGPVFNLSVASCAASGVLRGTLAVPAPVVDQATASMFVRALEKALAQVSKGEPTFGQLVAAAG